MAKEESSQNQASHFLLIYCTVPDAKTGEILARHLLSLKLIACANVYPGSMSFYEWDGKLCTHPEALLICKTKKIYYEKVAKEILKKHPYKCPGLFAFAFDKAHPPFLNWIKTQCS